VSLAEYLVGALDPVGLLIGLNGVILLAYIAAVPANEIVIPTILMLTMAVSGAGLAPGVMVEFETARQTGEVLVGMGGWTLLTGLNLMLFSLVHNPCSTTILTIYRETKSLKWTAVATFLPLIAGFALTFVVTQIARLMSLA
jgi:ferrous iron transport protein B